MTSPCQSTPDTPTIIAFFAALGLSCCRMILRSDTGRLVHGWRLCYAPGPDGTRAVDVSDSLPALWDGFRQEAILALHVLHRVEDMKKVYLGADADFRAHIHTWLLTGWAGYVECGLYRPQGVYADESRWTDDLRRLGGSAAFRTSSFMPDDHRRLLADFVRSEDRNALDIALPVSARRPAQHKRL